MIFKEFGSSSIIEVNSIFSSFALIIEFIIRLAIGINKKYTPNKKDRKVIFVED